VTAYYNEFDAYTAQWLRNLVTANMIAPGTVDERSIVDVNPGDLVGFSQCHFFAGIGGWSHALRLAGVPDSFPIWTGSCPCQPFSVAGKQGGFADSRHLWPEWFRLIKECRPTIIFGEQVGGPAGIKWLDAVFSGLEGIGYACGAANIPAASVGAPHIRQRQYFVAYGGGAGLEIVRLEQARREQQTSERSGSAVGLADSESRRQRIDGSASGCAGHFDRSEPNNLLGDPSREGSRRHSGGIPRAEEEGPSQREPARGVPDESVVTGAVDDVVADAERLDRPRRSSESLRRPEVEPDRFGATDFWDDVEWIACSDGKARPVKPGLECLVDGVPGRLADGSAVEGSRTGMLKGFGNAIVPPLAAVFIRASLEAIARL